jgi:hypothetical protein
MSRELFNIKLPALLMVFTLLTAASGNMSLCIMCPVFTGTVTAKISQINDT